MSLVSIKIFVSSPGDVAQERFLTEKVLTRLQNVYRHVCKLEPIFWEHEPLTADRSFQEGLISPRETDIVICILWSRLGTRLPKNVTGGAHLTGTEFEFVEAVEGRKQKGVPDLLVYRKTAKALADLSDKQRRTEALGQIEALETFFEKWFTNEEGALVAAFHAFERPDQFEEHIEHHLRKLIESRLAAAGISPEDGIGLTPTWLEGSPFRGLEHFDFEHEPIFFGRTKAIGEVIDRLKRQAEAGRAFLLVLGMSGSGKSSLIRAGVLPALSRPGVIEGVGLCRRVILRTGDGLGDVFDAIAAALLREEALPELANDGTTAAQLAQSLRENPGAAAMMVKGAISQAAGVLKPTEEGAKQPQARLLFLVDQLEELFANDKIPPDDRSKFARLLTSLACNPLSQTWVIAALRSDFYAPLAQVPELTDLKEGLGQYDLLSPSPAEIGLLVREPASAAGLHFEQKPESERLDDVLRDEASQDASLLPLLEFTLNELYDRRTERGKLTFKAYQAIGGVKGALAQRAESTFTDLPVDVQRELPAVFRRLVTVGTLSDEMATSQQTPLARFAASPTRMQFVQAFIAARLFVSGHAEDGSAVVRITHESLLARWERLQRWLADDRELLRVKARVERVTVRWLQEGRRADLLLTAGKPLDEAEQLQASGFELEAEVEEMIGASRKKACRNRRLRQAAIASLAALTLATSGFAVLARIQRNRANENARRADENAQGAFDGLLAKELEAEDWSASHLEHLDAIIAKIGRYSADEGKSSRERLIQRWAASLESQLSLPSLSPEAAARIQSDLVRLGQRDADRAASLRAALNRRQQTWETVFRLATPFKHLDRGIDPASVRIEGDCLKKASAQDVILTRIRGSGIVRLHAVFDGEWDSSKQLGLVVSAEPRTRSEALAEIEGADRVLPEIRGYRFLLRTVSPGHRSDGTAIPCSSFALARKGNEPIALEIYRDGILLRRKLCNAAKMAGGPLHLAAQRMGDRLSFTVDNLSTEFFDPVAYDTGLRAFGIEWPKEASLRELVALKQTLPEKPSPLQRGDALYAEARYAEALAEYQQQIQAAGGADVEQQIRYQETVCLLALKRQGEAESQFERLATEPGDRWPALASCRLWLMLVQQNRFEESDAIFDRVAAHYRLEDLAAFVPFDLSYQIVEGYNQQTVKTNLYKFNPNLVRMCKRALAIAEFFDCSRPTRGTAQFRLLRAYQAAGQEGEALALALQILKSGGAAFPEGDYQRVIAPDCCWTLRLAGRKQEALNELDRTMTPWPELAAQRITTDPEIGLHIDKVRALAALDRWDEAEKFLNQVTARFHPEGLGSACSSACGMRGFFRLRGGDKAGAIKAWKEAKEAPFPNRGQPLLDRLIVLSLSGDLSTEDIRKALGIFFFSPRLPSTDNPSILLSKPNALGDYLIQPEVMAQALRQAFHTPRGERYAREIIFRNVSFADCLRIPPMLMFQEIFRDEAFSGHYTPEQEELVWRAVGDLYTALCRTGKLDKLKILQFIWAWKGMSNFLGWGGLSPKLEPGLRGPLAYVIGHRYLQLKQPDDAKVCFRTSLGDAPANSSLARLARAELDRLARPGSP